MRSAEDPLTLRIVSPAMVKASYLIIPIGVAGIPVGIYDALSVSPLLGTPVAIIGLAVAALSTYKLRSLGKWPFV